jgi:hypothetical protein
MEKVITMHYSPGRNLPLAIIKRQFPVAPQRLCRTELQRGFYAAGRYGQAKLQAGRRCLTCIDMVRRRFRVVRTTRADTGSLRSGCFQYVPKS